MVIVGEGVLVGVRGRRVRLGGSSCGGCEIVGLGVGLGAVIVAAGVVTVGIGTGSPYLDSNSEPAPPTKPVNAAAAKTAAAVRGRRPNRSSTGGPSLSAYLATPLSVGPGGGLPNEGNKWRCPETSHER